jgi:hypothetical protein
MSASKKFDPIKFIDRLMSDGKRRSERQIVKALVEAYTEQAGQNLKAWVAAMLSTRVDQGLRWDERGPYNGKQDSLGTPTRYGYWRVEQGPEKIAPSDPFDRLPTHEEARKLAIEEAEAYETAERARRA